MAAGTTTPRFTGFIKWIYWILGILVLISIARFLYSTERPVAAILVFLSGLLGLYYYYVKWFIIPAKENPWPPFDNPCPDFLTMVDPGDPASGVPRKCMDFVGVCDNGMIKRGDPTQIKTQKENGDYIFTVETKRLGSGEPATIDQICQQTRTYGLTWAGLCPDGN